MKILYLITSTTRGGAENTLYNILSRVDRAAFAPARVISLKPAGPVAARMERLGVSVQSLNMGYLPGPLAAGKVRDIIADVKPDIVHAFLYRAIQFARAAKTPAFKLIASPRVNYRTRGPLILWWDRFNKDKDDLVISESDSSRDFLIKHQGYSPEKVITVRNGVDSGFWVYNEAERVETRFKADIKDDELLLFSSGRLDKQKGYEYLLRALALIKDRAPGLKTVIAGTGPLEKKLLNLAGELKLDYRVRFCGEQEHIRPWLSAADMFALPSLWEGVPNSLLEAMSAGKPCLATSVDGVLEVAEPETDILAARPASHAALADQLMRLYADPALRQKLSANAARAARERLSMRAMIAGYEAAYRDILK